MRHLLIQLALFFPGILVWGQTGQPQVSKFQAICSYDCTLNYESVIGQCDQSLDRYNELLLKNHLNPYEKFDSILIRALEMDSAGVVIPNYIFRSCDAVCTAAAAIDQASNNIVYYNAGFLDGLDKDTVKKKWIILGIFAHEIGHQIMGHTLLNYDKLANFDKRKNELRADFFSGYLLSKIPGATTDKALLALSFIDNGSYFPSNTNEEKNAPYPVISDRKDYVTKGFGSTKKDTLSLSVFKDIAKFALAKGYFKLYHVIDDKFSRQDFGQALSLAGEYIKQHPDDPHAHLFHNISGIINYVLHNHPEAIKQFDEAIQTGGSFSGTYINNKITIELNSPKKNVNQVILDLQKADIIEKSNIEVVRKMMKTSTGPRLN